MSRLPNPFSTQAIRPGAVEFQFFDQSSIEDIIRDFQTGCRNAGAIVGPHGSGKSTLLESLRPELENVFANIAWFRALSNESIHWQGCLNASLIVIDGFEQVGWWRQYRLIRKARKRQTALLVTMHSESRWLNTLHRTTATLDQAQEILTILLRDQPELIGSFAEKLSEIWPTYCPNMREAFFALYDYYENQTVSA